MRLPRALTCTLVAAAVLTGASCGEGRGPASATVNVIVSVSTDHAFNAFRPDLALGAGLDGHDQGATGQIYTAGNLSAMRSTGFGSLTYRLRTELGVEAWHWNPRGAWSDPGRRQGYWTSAAFGPRYSVSYGYRLPRRGNTIDQGNDDGYSRIDDGNSRTFWKSDPYLDRHFTGERDADHPQWVMVDLGRPRSVDAVRINWGSPYARQVQVQYWTGGEPLYFVDGVWHPFARTQFTGHPGAQSLRLGARITTRYVRLLLSQSSHTTSPGSRDVRDRLGFAVRELGIGTMEHGLLSDAVEHGARRHGQSVITVSSTDSWHRAVDIDRNTEQPSFDRVFTSRLTHRSALIPVAALYGTPADAAAEVRFLRSRHYPVRGVEVGEEPDGQNMSPEDYEALYRQFARAIKRAAPGVAVGGPGFQTELPNWYWWPDAHHGSSWLERFLSSLRAHRGLSAFGFFSFEWYPFDDVCPPPSDQIRQNPALLAHTLAQQRQAGLPSTIPIYITEYGYSSSAAEPEVDLPGAVLNADIVGQLLALGGSAAYLYGWEPDSLMSDTSSCQSWGNLLLFQADDQHRITHPLATYWAARLLTRVWTQPGHGLHLLYQTTSSLHDAQGRDWVSAYAVRQPDGRIAILLLNKDPSRSLRVHVDLRRGASMSPLRGPLELDQLGGAQYSWHANGAHGYPSPDGPPAHTLLLGKAPAVSLPPFSISVLRTGPAPHPRP